MTRSPANRVFSPGTLWNCVQAQTASALQCGALQPIPTEYQLIEQNQIPFLVRIVANLVRKDAAARSQPQDKGIRDKDFNPFLPYDPDLFVADLSETHVCLLNKFNVVDYHLLLVTRAFEEQESLLTLQDFEALWIALSEIPGLAFYNSGKLAGASQRHKHLQLVPLPLLPTGPQFPLERVIGNAIAQSTDPHAVITIPELPFQHGLMRLDPQWVDSPATAARETLQRYHTLLQTLNLATAGGLQAYNLLATREWLLIVPRSQERYESIAVNSLGFAGALLVRNQQQLQILQDQGPLTVLQQVAIPRKS